MVDTDRTRQIQRVLDECLRRRAGGEDLPDKDVIAEHPELIPELEERVAALQLIEQAGLRAHDSDGSSAAPAARIEGHRPRCQARWRVRAEHAGRRLRCRKCHGVFTPAESSSVGATAASLSVDAGTPATTPGHEIKGELGHGGMGRVYQARELATKRTVALKVMLVGPESYAEALGEPRSDPGLKDDETGTSADRQVGPVAELRAQALTETKRITAVRRVCNGRFPEIEEQAIEQGWSVERAELEVLRASRPKAPAVRVVDNALGGEVLEAACMLTAKLEKVKELCDEKTLEAASKRFCRGIGLQELLLEAV